jgi:hypothetical protein
MSTPEPPSYRLFSFRIDGKFGTLRLECTPGLDARANAEDLYHRFHTMMEERFPGCFDDGRISHLGYVDGFGAGGTGINGSAEALEWLPALRGHSRFQD